MRVSRHAKLVHSLDLLCLSFVPAHQKYCYSATRAGRITLDCLSFWSLYQVVGEMFIVRLANESVRIIAGFKDHLRVRSGIASVLNQRFGFSAKNRDDTVCFERILQKKGL